MNSEETMNLYSTMCLGEVSLSPSSVLTHSLTNDLYDDDDGYFYEDCSIDDKILDEFNKKSFDSTDSSFDEYSSTHDSDDDDVKYDDSWGMVSLKNLMDKLASLEESLVNEQKNNRLLKEQLQKLDHRVSKNNYYRNKDIDDLYDDLNTINFKMLQLDPYTRRESLVISGINKNITQDNLEYTVLDILKTIGVSISSYEITACHRLYNKSNKYPPRTIIRFTNRKVVEFCLRNRDRLKNHKKELNMNLRFFEHLTDNNETVLKECINLEKYGLIKSYYIRNGFVKIIIADGDKPFKIIGSQILYDKFKDYYDFEYLDYMP